MTPNPEDLNKLRYLIAAGMSPEQILQSQPMPSDGPRNELAQMLNSNMPKQALPTFDEFSSGPLERGQGYMTGSDGTRITFGQKTQDAPMAPRSKSTPKKMALYGAGEGQLTQLGQDAGEADIDYSRPQISIPGLGKGYYGKDGMTAYVPTPGGGMSKVLLGYDAEMSARLQERELKRRAVEADIAHTQEQTASSKAARSVKDGILGAGTPQSLLEKQFGHAPEGKRWTINGQLEDIPGGEKPLTESQGKAMGFGARMADAHEVLNYIGEGGKVQPGILKRFASSLPLVGDAAGVMANATQSAAQQQIEQAQRNFLNAVLRRESGAVIGPSEFQSGALQYFPQPGDSADVIAQKTRNREMAIANLSEESGPGKKKVLAASERARAMFDAKAAVRAGADKRLVNQRLQSMGMEPI